MCGSDTFTTVVSSTSMNVADITAIATSHGFMFGMAPAPAPPPCCATPPRLSAIVSSRLAADGAGDHAGGRFVAHRAVEHQVVKRGLEPVFVEEALDVSQPLAVG